MVESEFIVFLLTFLVALLETEWSGDSSVSFMTVSRASTAHHMFFSSRVRKGLA